MEYWELKLTELAYEALENPGYSKAIKIDDYNLDPAYRYCDSLTKKHSHTFYLASNLLPMPKRRAARALYAFCRISDDIVDLTKNDAQEGLKLWRQRTLSINPPENDPVAIAWLYPIKELIMYPYFAESAQESMDNHIIDESFLYH